MLYSQFIFADSSYWYLPVYLEFSLISISVSRLVLHLREAAESHHSHSLSEATSISLRDLATNIPLDDNHRHRHAADPGWDSRPSAAPRYSAISVQSPAYPVHAYRIELQQVRLSLPGSLDDAPSHISSRKTDLSALCMGGGDAPCAPNTTDPLGHAIFHASGIGGWKDDSHSRVEAPRAPD